MRMLAYFTGDTESPQALLAARHLDVAFVSPWLYHHESGQRVPECGQGCTVPRQGDVLRF